ncbi:hypothetical protein LMG24235_07247 [Paraburkholderia sabiae]|nr:hypothetical protein LMG24235_07247 [Paraburkholderia sabiae]
MQRHHSRRLFTCYPTGETLLVPEASMTSHSGVPCRNQEGNDHHDKRTLGDSNDKGRGG